MRSFFDANVLLEILLPGRRNSVRAIRALRTASSHTISPLTVHLYTYFGQKQGFILEQLLDDVNKYLIGDLGLSEVTWAIKNHQDGDFEDALQVACALSSDAGEFVTFDKNLAENYRKFINVKVL